MKNMCCSFKHWCVRCSQQERTRTGYKCSQIHTPERTWIVGGRLAKSPALYFFLFKVFFGHLCLNSLELCTYDGLNRKKMIMMPCGKCDAPSEEARHVRRCSRNPARSSQGSREAGGGSGLCLREQ